MFNDTSSPLSLLLTRRSGKARSMVAPGPDAAQMATIIAAATRVPDHGKLAPWRLVHVSQQRRAAFAAMLSEAYRAENPGAGRLEIEAMERFAHQAPELVILLSTPVCGSKIPLWEQRLSAGAVAMQLLNAAHASGFVGNWLTGWPAFSPAVAAALGADGAEDRIAGFFFIGSPEQSLEERPRPDMSDIFVHW